MEPLAENLWRLRFPLKVLGANAQRNVTVMRLRSGEIVVHSTGPFAPDDVAAISALGRVGWVMDVMLRHETFARQDAKHFQEPPFSDPRDFPRPPDSRCSLCCLPRRRGAVRSRSSVSKACRAWKSTPCFTCRRTR